MNTLPYIYDNLWKEHEIAYNEFHGYKFLEDLSGDTGTNILLFEKDNAKTVFGYNNGICLPLFDFDISNVHKKFRKDRITNTYDKIIKITKDKEVKDPVIYQFPYYSYICNHDICKFYGYDTKYMFGTAYVYDNTIDINYLHKQMRDGTKRIIQKYENNKLYDKNKINIYYGEISDTIFYDFIKKHLILAGRETKPKKCWDIIKEFIIQKKSILVSYEDNYIQMFCSKNFCYYGVNACDKHSDVCTILLYEGMKWLFKNGFNFFYFGSHNGDIIESKRDSINFYQASLSNKIFSNYLLCE
jgi:hypothetical protein